MNSKYKKQTSYSISILELSNWNNPMIYDKGVHPVTFFYPCLELVTYLRMNSAKCDSIEFFVSSDR